jgi:RimJ/RimL family protein N-acetyltransferase
MIDLAFDHYGVHRVTAQLDARNARSAALCERLGMRRESHKLRDFWSKGEWTDSFEYAVLAEEWRGIP